MRAFKPSLTLLIIPVAQSLLVVPSSPQCADLCGNVLSATSGSEMTCDDASYATSAGGATFKACLACELNSTYYDSATKESDLDWAIYNFRYALSWCLFGFDNNTAISNTPCITSFSCAPLQGAFEYDGLNPNASTYSYCPLMNSISIPKCSACLAETGNEHYLSNFVTVLNAACIQQPVLGASLSLQGSVFSTQVVNVTTPTPSSSSSYTPKKGGLTLGDKIGIVVGGILALMCTIGFCIIWNGKRRRRAALARVQRASGYAEWQSSQTHPDNSGTPQAGMASGPFFDSPQSQRPLTQQFSWDHSNSPESPPHEKVYFSPYSSNYNSPVSAVDGLSHAGTWQADRKLPIGEDQEPGERIEMVGVGEKGKQTAWQAPPPPVLHSPGHGRGGSAGLTEEDARRGNAL